LSALADITADEIKIDRSFITDIHLRPRSQGILRAIESLSEALGMTVIAEGIETFEELAYLQAATKIRFAQGYYFARPIFLEDLKLGPPPRRGAARRRAGRPAQENRARLFAHGQLSPLTGGVRSFRNLNESSCPGLSRASTSSSPSSETWMAGTSPAMTNA